MTLIARASMRWKGHIRLKKGIEEWQIIESGSSYRVEIRNEYKRLRAYVEAEQESIRAVGMDEADQAA